MTDFLTADAILAADDLQYDVVDCPEWGGKVRVRSITSRERDLWEASLLVEDGNGKKVADPDNGRAKLAIYGIVDANGKRIFDGTKAVDLGKKSQAAVDRCARRIMELSGIGEDAIKKLEAELRADPTFDSASPSPENSE